MLYFAGIPYLLVISGYLPARFLGLKGIEFLTLPNVAQPPAGIFNAVLSQIGNFFLVWLPDLGPWLTLGLVLSSSFVIFYGLYLQSLSFDRSAEIKLYDSIAGPIFDGVHWAFYRAILWSVSGSLYLGSLGSIFLVALEYTVAVRLQEASLVRRQQYLFRFGLGLMSAVIFLWAPNLWLALIFQTMLAALVEGLFKVVRKVKTAQLRQ